MRDVSRVEYDAALKRVRELQAAIRSARAICVEAADMGCECRGSYYRCNNCPDRIANRAQDAVEVFERLDSTLAALGLDEPPTEDGGLTDRQWAASICCGEDPRSCDRYSVCPMLKYQRDAPTEDEVSVRYTPAEHAEHFGYPLVPPPSETPKACPTCEASLGWAVREACPGCGSGIDGGTAA